LRHRKLHSVTCKGQERECLVKRSEVQQGLELEQDKEVASEEAAEVMQGTIKKSCPDCIINFRAARKLDLNYSQPQKKK